MDAGDQASFALAWAVGIVWAFVIPWIWTRRRRDGRLPTQIIGAMIVAIAAPALGGLLSALVYPDIIDARTSQTIVGAWRGAMLTAGVHAFWADRKLPPTKR